MPYVVLARKDMRQGTIYLKTHGKELSRARGHGHWKAEMARGKKNNGEHAHTMMDEETTPTHNWIRCIVTKFDLFI